MSEVCAVLKDPLKESLPSQELCDACVQGDLASSRILGGGESDTLCLTLTRIYDLNPDPNPNPS